MLLRSKTDILPKSGQLIPKLSQRKNNKKTPHLSDRQPEEHEELGSPASFLCFHMERTKCIQAASSSRHIPDRQMFLAHFCHAPSSPLLSICLFFLLPASVYPGVTVSLDISQLVSDSCSPHLTQSSSIHHCCPQAQRREQAWIYKRSWSGDPLLAVRSAPVFDDLYFRERAVSCAD